MNDTQIPEGYKQDRRGRLVPVESIKPVDLLRDDLVTRLITIAKDQHAALVSLKKIMFSEIEAFISLSISEYGVQYRGTKGNVELYSHDGRYKVQIAIQDSIRFDERLEAAKALVDECLREWTADSRPEIRTLITDAFAVDKKGLINTARVLGLRKLDIQDKKWQEAMKAIGEAVTVTGSTSYVRVYQRVGDAEKYEQITLDLAAV